MFREASKSFFRHASAIFIIGLLVASLLTDSQADALNAESSSSKTTVINHGEVQVEALINDLPQLQDIVQPNNPIWKWLQDAFNYSVDGIKIEWDPGPTIKQNPFGGETEILQGSTICFIRIDRAHKEGLFTGVNIRPEEVLAALVFELNNAKHCNELSTVWKMAREHNLSRNEFILANARLEFKAEAGVKSFLISVWQPYCKLSHFDSDETVWWPCQTGDFDIWMKSYPVGSAYPWKIYGDQYDRLIQDELEKK